MKRDSDVRRQVRQLITMAVLAWLVALIALFTSLPLRGQVVVSMDRLPSKGTEANLGRGLSAYTWNLHVCAIGNQAVPFTAIRLEFPEVRFYLPDQAAAILAARSTRSVPATLLRVLGYAGTAGGLALTVDAQLKRSPSQTGSVVAGTSAVAAAAAPLLAKAVPEYHLDAVPSVVALPPGQCEDYTALAAYSRAGDTIPVRRVDAPRAAVTPSRPEPAATTSGAQP